MRAFSVHSYRRLAAVDVPMLAAETSTGPQQGRSAPADNLTRVSTALVRATAPANDAYVRRTSGTRSCWRGLVHVSTDRGRAEGAPRGRPDHLLLRLRPDRPEPAPRQPRAAAPHAATCSSPATGRSGSVGGSTGLIGDPEPTAERTLNTQRDRRRVGRLPPGAGRQIPERRGRERRASREQSRLDRRRSAPSISCARSASTTVSAPCSRRTR